MIYAVAGFALAVATSSWEPAQAAPSPQGEASVQDFKRLQELAKSRLEAEKKEARTASVRSDGSISVVVDGRMELLSIIFRLAGNDEFKNDGLRAYAAYIDTRFRRFQDHPAVEYARRMRRERGVCCDAVVALAIHLGEAPSLSPRTALDDALLRERWRPEEARAFVQLARDFAQESSFPEFLRQSRPIYDLATFRMRRLVDRNVDQGWFGRFFGERPRSRFTVAVGLLNGAISYGVRVRPPRRSEELYASMGTWLFDQEGLPMFDDGVLSTVVHEFNHSFVNPVLNAHEATLRPAGEALSPKVADLMRSMGTVHWKTLIEESLVRAVVAHYLRTRRGSEAAAEEVTRQTGLGFVWTGDLVALMADYERSRDRYPTFERFLPRIAEYFSNLPNLLPAQMERYEAQRPKVQTATPNDGAEGVDPALMEIRVVFDRPMRRGMYATMPPPNDPSLFPRIARQGFDETGTVFTMTVKLEPDRTYELWLNTELSTGFRSTLEFPLKPYRIRFRTRSSVKSECEAPQFAGLDDRRRRAL